MEAMALQRANREAVGSPVPKSTRLVMVSATEGQNRVITPTPARLHRAAIPTAWE